jgi:replicative DNA helicase
MTPTEPCRKPASPLFHNPEAEQEILGAIIADQAVLALIDLQPDDFHEPLHAN